MANTNETANNNNNTLVKSESKPPARRGRPKGSKNKTKAAKTKLESVKSTQKVAISDVKAASVDTFVEAEKAAMMNRYQTKSVEAMKEFVEFANDYSAGLLNSLVEQAYEYYGIEEINANPNNGIEFVLEEGEDGDEEVID